MVSKGLDYIFFKGFRKHKSEILLDDSSFAPTRLTTDNTALWIQGGEARRASASLGRGNRTRSTQTRQRSSLASLSKYSNDHYEKAMPF